MAYDYLADVRRFLDEIDSLLWTAGKRDELEAKIAEAEALGVRPIKIHGSICAAKRDYDGLRRSVDAEGAKLIGCFEDAMVWSLQIHIDERRAHLANG